MTPSEFRAAQPKFAGVGDTDIQRWVLRADPYFDVGMWASFYSDGLAAWVAHKLLVEGTAAGLPAMPIIGNLATMKKVGSEAISYSDKMLQSVIDEPMNATAPGREYVYLRDNQAGRGWAAV